MWKVKRTREEILENDLGGLSLGDGVYHVRKGAIKIEALVWKPGIAYPIASFAGSFTINGRAREGDYNPVLFESLENCIEYFQEIKKTEEEINVWTLEKIHRAFKFGDKIEIYNGLSWYEGCVYISHNMKGFDFVQKGDVLGGEIDGYRGADWKGFEFRDWDGNLIDPRGY